MGRDKALLPWPPSSTNQALISDTFLSAAIRLFFSHVDVVLVVVGNNEAALAPIVYANGAALVINPDPVRGQFSSLRVGPPRSAQPRQRCRDGHARRPAAGPQRND